MNTTTNITKTSFFAFVLIVAVTQPFEGCHCTIPINTAEKQNTEHIQGIEKTNTEEPQIEDIQDAAPLDLPPYPDKDLLNIDSLSCQYIVNHWNSFLKARQRCQTDSNCTSVTSQGCGCADFEPGGISMNRIYKSEVRAYFYRTSKCGLKLAVCDPKHPPLESASCQKGYSVAKYRRSCQSP